MKFRKKPVVVEALQLFWSSWNEMCSFAGVAKLSEGKPEGCYVNTNGEACTDPNGRIGLHIPTKEGLMLASEGDWVIRGIAGELYPCKPEIFEQTYEEVVP